MSRNNERECDNPPKGASVRRHLPTVLLIVVFLAGIAVILYPTVSNIWNSKVQSRAIVDYEHAVSHLTHNDYSALFSEADKYNTALRSVDFPLMYFDTLRDRDDLLNYEDILNVTGSGIMGYITIDRIGVKLPIYHGTSDAVLNAAAGHLEGTSLPVGGESTHSVLSAHRGLPSATLFSDLDELEPRDTFVLNVLDRELAYEVFEINIVEPNVVDLLYVREGEDLCTLVTCTPYGINTHRLLVTGRRIEPDASTAAMLVSADGVLIDELVIAPILAALLLTALLLIIMMLPRRRSGKGNRDE